MSRFIKKPVPKLTISILAMLGPAFVWSSVAQGSGELIWWPYFVAKYGTAFIGLLLPAALMQYFINAEVSRYTALTGEGVWAGFRRIGKWYSIPLFMLAFVSFLWFGGYASAGGTALFDLIGFPFGVSEKAGSLFWAYLTMGVFVIGMFFSGSVYKLIEKFMKIIAGITITGLSISVLQPEVFKTASTYFSHLFNPFSVKFPVNWDPLDTSKLVTALAFAGMGGFLNLMYSYWMRDKGVGMSIYSEKVKTLIKKRKEETVSFKGYFFNDTSENKKNWVVWKKYLILDNLFAVLINAFTVTLTAWLALALLYPKGIFPAGWKIAVVQAEFFESWLGTAGRIMFLIIAAAFMSDTWLGLADGVSRQFADFTQSHFKSMQKKSFSRLYYGWLVFLIVVTSITMLLAQPEVLIVITGVISIFAFVLFIPALYYLNYIKLPRTFPKWIVPGKINAFFLWLVWAVYVSIAGWYLIVTF